VGDSRKLFMVLSPHSLPYARLALRSLFDNCVEDFHLSLITDSRDDAVLLSNELAELQAIERTAKRNTHVYAASDLLDSELDTLAKQQHIRNFRLGHPCWRKITDPLLLSGDKDEMIVLDPDLYFPNRFSFEPTPDTGVFLMWQRPSCLLPDEVVRRAIDAKIALAHHTDIGVAQWRMPVDLDWLDWLIGKLGTPQLPRSMHVESIVWAALAMRLGGGHLDPRKMGLLASHPIQESSCQTGSAGRIHFEAGTIFRDEVLSCRRGGKMVVTQCEGAGNFGLRAKSHHSCCFQIFSRIDAIRILFLTKESAVASQIWILSDF
jgi:hypothetical protein